MDLLINFKLFSITRTISISKYWLQFGIITAVILASTVISFWGSPILFLLVLVLLIGMIVTFTLLRQPNLGFILIFLGGAFIPITGPSGLSAATVMVAVMLGLWIMEMFIVRRNFQFIRSPIMV